jgi:hypothetical protein
LGRGDIPGTIIIWDEGWVGGGGGGGGPGYSRTRIFFTPSPMGGDSIVVYKGEREYIQYSSGARQS